MSFAESKNYFEKETEWAKYEFKISNLGSKICFFEHEFKEVRKIAELPSFFFASILLPFLQIPFAFSPNLAIR